MTLPSFEELMGEGPRQQAGLPSFNDLVSKEEEESLFTVKNVVTRPYEAISGLVTGANTREQLYEENTKIINRVKNIPKLMEAGLDLVFNQPVDTQVAAAWYLAQAENQPAGFHRATSDIRQMFSRADLSEAIVAIWKGGVERVKERKAETLRSLFSLPYQLVNSVVGDTWGAITGVDVSGDNIRPLLPEEYARATKATIGNLVAAAAAPGVSKVISMGFEAPAARALGGSLANASTAPLEAAAKVGAMQPRIGSLGRAIISDVSAGAAAGMAQGAIANANTPEAYSAAITGLMFAPIGVLTGWYRGANGGRLEDAITEAQRVSQLRQWQELENANIESAAKKVEALLTSDTIEKAISHSDFGRPGLAAIRIGNEVFNATADANWHPAAAREAAKKIPEIAKLQDDMDGLTSEEWNFGLKLKDGREVEFGFVNENGQFTKYNQETFNVDNLYKDFEKFLNEDDAKPFHVALVEYTERKGLQNNINELLHKFSTKYVETAAPDEINHLRELIRQHRKTEAGQFPTQTHGDLIATATEHGFFLTNEHGLIRIRDIESGDILASAPTSDHAKFLMEKMGKPANAIDWNANGKAPSSGIPTPPASGPGISPHPADDFEPQFGNLNKRLTAWDMGKLQVITGMNGFVEAIDTHFGTNLKQAIFEPLERAHRVTNLNIRGDLEGTRMQSINAMAKKMSASELETVGQYLETQTVDEIMAPGGYSKGFQVDPKALQLAQFAHKNGIDLTKVLYFRRSQAAIKAVITQKIKKAAYEQFELNQNTGMSLTEAAQIYDDAVSNIDKLPEFQEMMAKLYQTFSPDQNFLKAVKAYDDLFNTPDGAAHAAAAGRLKLALERPTTHGSDRATFAATHKMTGQQRALALMLEEAYDFYGKKFGIQDSRMINRYMNHYRQYGDILDSYVIGDFERGIMDGAMRQFVSSMIRTGEVAQYSMNPVLNLGAYIRGGNKGQFLYPVLEDLLNRTDSEFAKIYPEIQARDPVVAKLLKRRFDQYQRDISGQLSIGDKEALHAQARALANMLTKDGKPMYTPEQMIAKLQQPDHLDTMLAFSTSGLLGGRWSMAFRDNMDVIGKHFYKYGSGRTNSLVFQRVTKADIDRLVEAGEITRPDPIDYYNVTHMQGKGGTLSRFAKDMADLGFKTSLQAHFYMRNQAAVYINTVKHVNNALKEYHAGRMTFDGLVEAVELRRFDPGTQRLFAAYTKDQIHAQSAATLLARQDVREMVGVFQRGNQSPVLNSKIGKLFGQLGSWGMTNRSVLQNLLSRGNRKDITKSLVRYAIFNASIGLAGRAMGLNLGRWMLLPTSVLVSGGPVYGLIEDVGSFASSTLGGSEKQTHFTEMELGRSLTQFMPFSGAIRDVKKATELQTEGTGFGPGRTAAQAIGIGVNTEDRSFLDWVMGNYPVKW